MPLYCYAAAPLHARCHFAIRHIERAATIHSSILLTCRQMIRVDTIERFSLRHIRLRFRRHYWIRQTDYAATPRFADYDITPHYHTTLR